MSPGLPILYICAIGGLFTIAASFVLLWKRRIYLDRATKKVTEIELPFGIKVKSHAPVILLILIGGVLLMYSAAEVRKFGEEVTVDGKVSGSGASIELFASIASQSLPRGGEFNLSLPVTHPSRKYMLLYAVDGNLIAHQLFDPDAEPKKGLEPLELYTEDSPRLVGEIDPVPPGY